MGITIAVIKSPRSKAGTSMSGKPISPISCIPSALWSSKTIPSTLEISLDMSGTMADCTGLRVQPASLLFSSSVARWLPE